MTARCARTLALTLGTVLGTGGALALPAVAQPPPEHENALRVDGLAAVVGALAPGPGVLTLYRSDVELRARMALLSAGSLAQALGPLPAGLLSASLIELVGEALIAVESSRLSLAPPSEAALADARARLLGARASEARELMTALGVSDGELAAWVRRRAVVAGFLQANLEGTLALSPDALERAFTSEPHPFEGQPFEAVRARFAAWLAEQRMQAAVRRWVESLRERTPHRVLASY